MEANWWAKTMVELKTELKSRELPISGKKADLVDRLIASDEHLAAERELVTIFAKSITGMVITVKMKKEDTIGDVKVAISKKSSFPPECIVLKKVNVVGGAPLKDDESVQSVVDSPYLSLSYR